MRTINIIRDYYENKNYLYTRKTASFEPGLTILIGCNGIGKSTLLNQIKYELDKDNIPVFYYDNIKEGGHNAISSAVYHNNLSLGATLLCSSEGESLFTNFAETSRKMGEFVRKNSTNKEIWFLFDAIDSGLSIDGVNEIKTFLMDCLIDMNIDKDIYIIISANEYELARNEKCFNVYNCKYIDINSYEDYRNAILKSREYKDKRNKEDK